MSLPGSDPESWQYRVECEISPDGELTVRTHDDSLLAWAGYSRGDFDAPQSWVKAVPAADVARTLRGISDLAQGVVWDDRLRVRTATGELRVLHVRATPSRGQKGRVSVSVGLRDVTQVAALEAELAERTERLRLLEQEIGLAMWSTDDALRFTWSSGSALEDVGFAQNALVRTSLYELFETEDWTFAPIAAHHRALEGSAVSFGVEWEGRLWRGRVGPLRDELGRVCGVVGVGVDEASLLDVARGTRSMQHYADPPEAVRDVDDFAAGGPETISVGDLRIDPQRFEVLKNGSKIPLTVTEFKLLMEFALRRGRVLSRDVLAERVWGHEFYGNTASITMAISRLRDKIEDDPAAPRIIETVRGVGYRLGGAAWLPAALAEYGVL